MNTELHPALARLGAGHVMKIEGGKGHVLAVFDGLVWVTQDGDPRDTFVEAGRSFTFGRPGLALVEAIREARLAVLAPMSAKEDSNEHALA